jgi:hypothetical protein
MEIKRLRFRAGWEIRYSSRARAGAVSRDAVFSLVESLPLLPSDEGYETPVRFRSSPLNRLQGKPLVSNRLCSRCVPAFI